jgi:hypothetical protein
MGIKEFTLVEHGHIALLDDPVMQGTHLDGSIAVRCVERGHR